LAVELVQEIGRGATLFTAEPRESTFLFQQLSITLQRGNAVAFLNTFDSVAVIPCLVQCFALVGEIIIIYIAPFSELRRCWKKTQMIR